MQAQGGGEEGGSRGRGGVTGGEAVVQALEVDEWVQVGVGGSEANHLLIHLTPPTNLQDLSDKDLTEPRVVVQTEALDQLSGSRVQSNSIPPTRTAEGRVQDVAAHLPVIVLTLRFHVTVQVPRIPGGLEGKREGNCGGGVGLEGGAVCRRQAGLQGEEKG